MSVIRELAKLHEGKEGLLRTTQGMATHMELPYASVHKTHTKGHLSTLHLEGRRSSLGVAKKTITMHLLFYGQKICCFLFYDVTIKQVHCTGTLIRIEGTRVSNEQEMLADITSGHYGTQLPLYNTIKFAARWH